ncbi:hypothetical protein TNCV_3762111 [Trichonephila clavipes]|nr:hypothetical protein TNCV_3762111 [Trichonephila clavipes]
MNISLNDGLDEPWTTTYHSPNGNPERSLDLTLRFLSGDTLALIPDEGLPICAIEVKGIADLSEPMNIESDAKTDDETPIKSVTFSTALQWLETENIPNMQQYVNDAVLSSQHQIKKVLF